MTKTTYLAFCFLLACILNSTAQNNSKLDLRTFTRLQNGEVKDENMHLLVKGDVTRIKQLAEKHGGRYKYGYKDIAAVEIPEKNLIAFSKEYEIQEIENTSVYGVALMDTARIRNNIDSAQTGYAPLPHDLKGRGVIVGIIDGGIFWKHPDFKNANGTTRIRYIWDEGVTGPNKPLPYNYGMEWNWIEINNNNCSHVEPVADSSHGTCVAGIAAGNGNSVAGDTLVAGKYTGVAPESEIIAVRVDFNAANFAAHMADAVDYIFKKADALGRPCVINTSVGSYSGSHDGKDITTQLIETLLDERNGRVLVAAAGNAGLVPQHLSYTITNDSAYTFFKYSNRAGAVAFDWWADSADFRNARFAIGCNNDTDGISKARTAYLNVITDFNPAPNNSVMATRTLFDATSLLGSINFNVTLTQGRYHVEVVVSPTPANAGMLWSLQTTGSGKFDLWSDEALIGSSDMVEVLNGSPIQFPDYKFPDHLKTITSLWQCSNKVVTVGNYSNRAGYLDEDSSYVDLVNVFPVGETVGSRYRTSSFGPTRDNRLKPDIMATGSTIICTGDSIDIRYRNSHSERYRVALGGKHIRNGGTSMASAIVAGIAALYLEKRPTANYSEIKTALICTAVKDSFTGPIANNEYGNGKVNAFAALTQTNCITFGAMDTACINYNQFANVDSGSCVAKVYGCMDSTADNYNPQANINTGTCTYTGIKNIYDNGITLQAIPNPFAGQTTFKIEGLDFEKGEIKIFNQLGAFADGIKLSSGKSSYVYRSEKLSKGIYYYVLNADGKNLKAGKLVVE